MPARGCLGAAFNALPLANVTLSLGEETPGTPFFNDAGQLTPPQQSMAELEESMAETRLFRPSPQPLSAPPLAAPSPGF